MLKKQTDRKKDRKNLILILLIIPLSIIVISLSICGMMFLRGKTIDDYMGKEYETESIGLELVNALYNFSSPYELNRQMEIVNAITTESVYNDLTIDNEERTMLTYLKFKDSAVTVHVIDNGPNYVRYYLETDAIDSSREFILFYQINDDGLISEVEEAEYVKFIDTIY